MFGTPNRTGAWLSFAQRSRDEGGLGLAPHQAAGLVGNLVNESGQDLNPWGPTGDNGTAWGTAQWRNDRLARLKARPDYQTMEGQQAFMREELDSTENKAYRALLAAKTPEEAAHAWDAHYERSDGSTRDKRMQSARSLMSQFGQDAGPGALTSSYAPTESKTMPALSADNTMGPGILNSDGGGAYTLGAGLTNIGAALAGINSPDQAKALLAQAASMKKMSGKWTHQVLPNGQLMVSNADSPQPQLVGKPGDYSKDDTFIPVHSTDASTGLPRIDVLNKNTGQFMNAQAGQAGPGLPETLEELKKQNPSLATQVEGVNEGRIPYPNASRLNPQQTLLKNAVSQYFPGVDATTFAGRQAYMKNLGTDQPSQPGGQFVGLGHTLDMARQLAEKYVGMGNVDVGYGVGHFLNSTKEGLLPMSNDRAAKVNALDENVDRMASEVGRLFSGSQGGGVHERENTRSRFGGEKTPTEAAEALKSVRDMVLSRNDELLSQADRLGIPRDRIPGLDKVEGTLTQLNGHIDTLSGKRKDTAKPAIDMNAIDAEIARRAKGK